MHRTQGSWGPLQVSTSTHTRCVPSPLDSDPMHFSGAPGVLCRSDVRRFAFTVPVTRKNFLNGLLRNRLEWIQQSAGSDPFRSAPRKSRYCTDFMEDETENRTAPWRSGICLGNDLRILLNQRRADGYLDCQPEEKRSQDNISGQSALDVSSTCPLALKHGITNHVAVSMALSLYSANEEGLARAGERFVVHATQLSSHCLFLFTFWGLFSPWFWFDFG